MINRQFDKEQAQLCLKKDRNLSGMVGMEILYTVISTLTVTSLTATFVAALSGIFGTALASAVISAAKNALLWGGLL